MAAGNETAFRQLFDYYWNHIYSVAFSMTKSVPLSEEIVQDVFLKVWLKRAHLPSISNFDGYLFMIARNHIYNVLRKKSVERPFVEYLEENFLQLSASPDEAMVVKETGQLIKEAVEKLSVQQRSVYELSRNEGLNHSEIAEKLSISKLTVKSHMTKALQYIRQHLIKRTDTELLFLLFIAQVLVK